MKIQLITHAHVASVISINPNSSLRAMIWTLVESQHVYWVWLSIEQMLIARANPIMCLYRKHGGERGYHGHILNLPQDIQNFLDQLPANINELPALLIRRTTDDGIHMWDERKFLMHCNGYKLITLSTLMLLSGTPIWTNYLKMVSQTSYCWFKNVQMNSHLMKTQTKPKVALPFFQFLRELWPKMQVFDPWSTKVILSLGQLLVVTPSMNSKLNNTSISYTVSVWYRWSYMPRSSTLSNTYKCVQAPDMICWNSWWTNSVALCYSHPGFLYWALNIKMRHQLISQTSIYLHHHPADGNLANSTRFAWYGRTTRLSEFDEQTSTLCCKGSRIQPILVPKIPGVACTSWSEGLSYLLLDPQCSWPDLHSLMPQHSPSSWIYL